MDSEGFSGTEAMMRNISPSESNSETTTPQMRLSICSCGESTILCGYRDSKSAPDLRKAAKTSLAQQQINPFRFFGVDSMQQPHASKQEGPLSKSCLLRPKFCESCLPSTSLNLIVKRPHLGLTSVLVPNSSRTGIRPNFCLALVVATPRTA